MSVRAYAVQNNWANILRLETEGSPGLASQVDRLDKHPVSAHAYTQETRRSVTHGHEVVADRRVDDIDAHEVGLDRFVDSLVGEVTSTRTLKDESVSDVVSSKG
jgi:hypothetical protein